MKDLIKFGKRLSYLLRHDKEYKFDNHGYRTIADLVKNHGFTRKIINDIVNTNDKQRYEFNLDKTKIRARQGHSIKINVDLKKETPPKELYHGTSENFLPSILKSGILKMKRNFVHLSDNKNTALNVGKRHGKPVILTINSELMNNDGVEFFLSNNNVWLTDFVDKKYIKDILF